MKYKSFKMLRNGTKGEAQFKSVELNLCLDNDKSIMAQLDSSELTNHPEKVVEIIPILRVVRLTIRQDLILEIDTLTPENIKFTMEPSKQSHHPIDISGKLCPWQKTQISQLCVFFCQKWMIWRPLLIAITSEYSLS